VVVVANGNNGNGKIRKLRSDEIQPGEECRKSRHKDLGTIKAHIVPKTRGGGNGNNIHKERCVGCENDYHGLFDVMTPEEVIEHLVEAFWNGDDGYVHSYIKNKDT